MHHILILLSLVFVSAFPSPSLASSDVQLEPHVHGTGTMYVRPKGNIVHIELISPAADIVGFETEAKAETEKSKIRRTIDTLHDGKNLFEFNAEADCRFSKAETTHHRAYRKEAKTGKDSSHAEFRSKYEFICILPQKLSFVRVKINEKYKNLKTVKVRKKESTQTLQGKDWTIQFPIN